jgi:hypothetical protein
MVQKRGTFIPPRDWGMKMIVRIASVTLALLLCQTVFADEAGYTRHRHRYYLSPAHHVVEVVVPPYSGRFVINGFRYDGVGPACLAWVPGERVRLISGSWFGDCASATFYNVSRGNTCTTQCLGRAWW